MAVAAAEVPHALRGHPKPRLAPPLPLRSDIAKLRAQAVEVGITFMPWQDVAGTYLEALDPDDRHLYREIGLIVSRQNGKTEILIPSICKRLRAGRRIMHTAQDRALPREVFYEVADIFWDKYRELFPERNGRATKPRYANGQEEIRLSNGGVYSIVAPTRSGARGPTRDDVLVDELREMDAWDFIAAAKPTMTVSPDPQIIYLSNMGDERSIVLNALRQRRDADPSLAYLEWSASPERRHDDREGWAEGNPAMGHEPEGMGSVLATLESEHRTAVLEGTLAIFETEHLCRAVPTLRPSLVDIDTWSKRETSDLPAASRPVMAVSMDPKGSRASAALAWAPASDRVALRMLFDVTGNPIDTARLGKDMRATARELGATLIGFDPLTDEQLARHFIRKERIAGQKFANATARFVEVVESGQLVWSDAAAVGADLAWTSRKADDATGAFQAVRADDDRPITAALAAIRAVWLASKPKPDESSDVPSAMGF